MIVDSESFFFYLLLTGDIKKNKLNNLERSSLNTI